MPTDCPICLEPLFDSEGIASPTKEVAKTMCIHLVHSDCLARAGRTLNSNGQRYGVSAFGNRAGCPLCAQLVSFWFDYKEAAAFPIFWMHRVQAKMDQIGPNEGPILIHRITKMLKNDPTLTNGQKTYLRDGSSAGIGFPQAMKDGSHAFVNKVINGGPKKGGSICSSFKPGPWDLDERNKTVWLYKWSEIPETIITAARREKPETIITAAWRDIIVVAVVSVILAVLYLAG
jgi:hypothetical protein